MLQRAQPVSQLPHSHAGRSRCRWPNPSAAGLTSLNPAAPSMQSRFSRSTGRRLRREPPAHHPAALFAVTAVSLACIGLYGTVSYLGRLRQREVGVRLALGALRSQIVRKLPFPGSAGSRDRLPRRPALGVGLTHFLGGMLYGVSALDPATYAGVVLLILVVAALASLAPAVRVAWVEPDTHFARRLTLRIGLALSSFTRKGLIT